MARRAGLKARALGTGPAGQDLKTGGTEVGKRVLAAAATIAALVAVPSASAITPEQSAELREELTLAGMREHLEKFQAVANAHQGNRAASTVGYEQSVAYVSRRLEDAGYDVRLEPFDFPIWTENATPELSQVTPTPTDYVAGGPEDSDSDAVDFITFQFSGAGDVTAPVVPTTDIVIPPGEANASTSGCEMADYPAETEGAISLIQRGTCPFVQKLQNAADAGAAAVILFNEGQTGRTAPLFTTAPTYYPIPAVFSSFAVGEELHAAFEAEDAPTARVAVDATTTPNVQHNVIADSPWGDANKPVVVVGHLDSVQAGPGINDNGSGTAAILETGEELSDLAARAEQEKAQARQRVEAAQRKLEQRRAKLKQAKKKLKRAKKKVKAAKREARGDGPAADRKLAKAKRKVKKARAKRNRLRARVRDARRDLREAEQALAEAETRFAPQQRLRLAFWGAEEAGLIGSTQYVAQRSPTELAQIMLNLNFDMLASPNFVRFVYDGNTNETEPPEGGAPPGSDVIEQVFLDYFASQGLATAPTAFDGRSDYGPFIAQGIPAGGLFSGAEVEKTPAQVTTYGGVAGEQYDPCYHEACDTFDSVFGAGSGVPGLDGNGATSLDQMSDAVAHTTLHFLTEPNPLGTATAAKQTTGKRSYRLDFRGHDMAAR
jgi:Zn-dependent M28 family amino/carboxypeptidase